MNGHARGIHFIEKDANRLKKQGCLIVLSGPSGCGKNTVYEALRALEPSVTQTVSATTRAPRTGEAEGIDYYFLSEEQFREKIAADDFVEYVRYGENYYGTLKCEVARLLAEQKTVVLIIEVNGARNVKRIYPACTTIFISPPSMEVLRERLLKRGENTAEETERRIAIAAAEMECRDMYDYQVVNDDLDSCVRDVYHIVKKAKENNASKGEEIK